MAAALERQQTGSVPVPDPTTLTKEATQRTETSLKEYIDIRIENINHLITRLQKEVDSRKEDIKIEIVHLNALLISEIKKLQEVSNEKFNRIDGQFVERDNRTKQLAEAASTAIAAALQAQKEAVGEQNKSGALAIAKSESSTIENIRQLNVLFNTTNIATNEKIDMLTQRLDRTEGQAKGAGVVVGWIVGGVGLVATLLAIVTGVIAFVR